MYTIHCLFNDRGGRGVLLSMIYWSTKVLIIIQQCQHAVTCKQYIAHTHTHSVLSLAPTGLTLQWHISNSVYIDIIMGYILLHQKQFITHQIMNLFTLAYSFLSSKLLQSNQCTCTNKKKLAYRTIESLKWNVNSHVRRLKNLNNLRETTNSISREKFQVYNNLFEFVQSAKQIFGVNFSSCTYVYVWRTGTRETRMERSPKTWLVIYHQNLQNVWYPHMHWLVLM